MKVSGLFCCAIYAKGLQNREKSWYPQSRKGWEYAFGHDTQRFSNVLCDNNSTFCILQYCILCADTLPAHLAIRPEDDYKGRIPQFHSCVDRDDDGVDDQSDILNGALAYVSTHPKYKSRYYKAGYPDDGYGVCTDVVAYALKNAGYDLQELVDADIREQPQDYMVEEPGCKHRFPTGTKPEGVFCTHKQLPWPQMSQK